jgi:hypothetical protein
MDNLRARPRGSPEAANVSTALGITITCVFAVVFLTLGVTGSGQPD